MPSTIEPVLVGVWRRKEVICMASLSAGPWRALLACIVAQPPFISRNAGVGDSCCQRRSQLQGQQLHHQQRRCDDPNGSRAREERPALYRQCGWVKGRAAIGVTTLVNVVFFGGFFSCCFLVSVVFVMLGDDVTPGVDSSPRNFCRLELQ